MGKPLVIIGALLVLMFNATFQAATMQHRLIAMGAVVAGVLALGWLGSRIGRGPARRPAPRAARQAARRKNASAARSAGHGSR